MEMGGRGGCLSCGNKGLWTLFHLKFARHIKADGGDGSGTEVLVLMEMINS
jgi:GTP-binding protein